MKASGIVAILILLGSAGAMQFEGGTVGSSNAKLSDAAINAMAMGMDGYSFIYSEKNSISTIASSMDDPDIERKSHMCLDRGNQTADEFLRQCTACQLNGMDVPKIYIKEGNDGLGSRLHDIIAGVALAAKSRMALAGVSVGPKACGKSHGINILEAAGSFFGLQNPNLMFKFKDPDTGYCQIHPSAKSFLDTLKKYGMPGPNCNILISSNFLSRELSVHGSASSWYTPRLRQELRKGFIWKKPLAFKTGSTSIAIHIRRGDVNQGVPEWEDRGTSDQWYFSLIAQLKTLVPRADIHVFSYLEGDSSSSDFDGYRTRGATVHLDEADPIETWAHLVSADVFVMAKSSFSYVPALLNDNCLVYQGFWHAPLDGWVSAQADEEAPLDAAAVRELRGCIAARTGAQ